MINWGAFFSSSSAPRSPHWETVRRKFINGKKCAGCESSSTLEAHHIVPFDVNPDLELEPNNLICLCRECHFQLGHLRNWSAYNPSVIDDSAVYLQRFLESRLRLKRKT